LSAMVVWSVLPFGNLAWFAGIAALTWLLARWEHQRQDSNVPVAPPSIVPSRLS
jgi:hypothetical protein